MENKNKKSKAIIISTIVLIILSLTLFLIYKNKDSFGVKTSSVLTKIFNPLETSDNKKKELINAGEEVSKTSIEGEPTEIGKSSAGNINSFWNSFSKFLGNTFKFKQACSDGKDNDGDGLIDIDDPNCHIDGDLTKEYVPKHFSESESPYSLNFICSDGKDNDGDGLIDIDDPNCHIDGDLTKEYVPKHFSESESPHSLTLGIDGVDLMASIISPISSPVNTEVQLMSTISNRGNSDSVKEIDVLFTISDSKEGQSGKNIYLSTTIPQVSSLSKGLAFVKHSFSSVGNYYIRACADKKDISDEGSIVEAFEENNCGGWVNFSVRNVLPDTGRKPECSDGRDNDGDGLIDINDPNCHAGGVLTGEYLPEYDSESRTPTECSDTLDNDNDGLIDRQDPACHEGGDINKAYLPDYNSESTRSFACNDTIDNDGDGFIDEKDPNCHIDGILSNEYKPTHDSESESPTEDKCVAIDQNPITFTQEEKAKLADLTKKFFLISPSLQSEESISRVYLDILDQDNFTGQLDTLIKECYAETSSPTYTGPKAKYGNPWFDYNNRGSYLDERAIADYLNEDPYANKGIEAIQGCTPELVGQEACRPQISDTFGYCTRDYKKPDPHKKNYTPEQCGMFKTFETCRMYGRGYQTGCTWVYTFPIRDYEALLDVW